jgi:hypothetical protein
MLKRAGYSFVTVELMQKNTIGNRHSTRDPRLFPLNEHLHLQILQSLPFVLRSCVLQTRYHVLGRHLPPTAISTTSLPSRVAPRASSATKPPSRPTPIPSTSPGIVKALYMQRPACSPELPCPFSFAPISPICYNELKAYFLELVHSGVSRSYWNQAISAVKFLYRHVLRRGSRGPAAPRAREEASTGRTEPGRGALCGQISGKGDFHAPARRVTPRSLCGQS